MGLPIIGPHSPMPMLTEGAQYVKCKPGVNAECELCGVLFNGHASSIFGSELWLCYVCWRDVAGDQLQEWRSVYGGTE